ncbi:MAG: hypothetical protein DMF60_01400 [Acidobacteria bacterium]|nr:MAG: hypothetical protein DMF60_01400 [Acidobacteriota bacterium]
MNVVATECIAALGLLLFGLGLTVSGLRRRTVRYFGYEGDPTDMLYKVVRAHGNTAEYAPFLAVLMLYLGSHNPATWVIGVMVAATACRYLLVVGMLFSSTIAKTNLVRFVGAMGTYICGVALCVAVIRGA